MKQIVHRHPLTTAWLAAQGTATVWLLVRAWGWV